MRCVVAILSQFSKRQNKLTRGSYNSFLQYKNTFLKHTYTKINYNSGRYLNCSYIYFCVSKSSHNSRHFCTLTSTYSPGASTSSGNMKETPQEKKYAVEVLDTPDKGISDKKDYRSLRLANGLRVLLVSDLVRHGPASEPAEYSEESEETNDRPMSASEDEEGGEHEGGDEGEDEEGGEEGQEDEECVGRKENDAEYKAAASLSVSWGSCVDPAELPGLMHFLEHMVFMGSSKYTRENSFDDFIRRHGGDDNAYTDNEHTNFHFCIQEQQLHEGLDRFMQFFIAPLMKRDAMDRERCAVDSEFTMALPNDENREQQILQSLAPTGHPCAGFMWGNAASLTTLPDDQVHRRLHQHREKYYSAQYMTLAVQSRHTLDTMQEWVTSIASLVPNNGLPQPDWGAVADPFPASAVNKVVYAEPMKDKHTLSVTWFLPPLARDYRRHPLRYVSHLIGHEGVGSLASYLKEQTWSNEVCCECETGDFDSGSFNSHLRVVFDLTVEGFANVEKIIFSLFQYTALLRSQPPNEKIFKEFQNITKLYHDFEVESSTISNVESLTSAMLEYPSKDYLTGNMLMFDYDPEFITSALQRLTPDKASIFIRSRLLGDLSGPDVKTEEWFGTKHTIQDFSEEWRGLFESASTVVNPALHLPHANPFIPTDFSLLPTPKSSALASTLPEELQIGGSGSGDSYGRLFYKPDYKFGLPMAVVKIQFMLQDFPERREDHFKSVVTLWLICLEHHLKEVCYPASLARYNHELKIRSDCIVLTVTGFSQHIYTFLELLLDHMDKFVDHFEERHFLALQEQEVRRIYNFAIKPATIRNLLRLHVLLDECGHPLALLQQTPRVTAQSVLHCAATVLHHARVNMLVQGNVTEAEARRLYNSVQARVARPATDQPVLYIPLASVRELRAGVTVVRLASINPADGNSAIGNYYQGCPGTVRGQLLQDFLTAAIEERCFDILRTQEQLGYSVYTQPNESNGVLGLSLYVTPQAEKFSLHHVDSRIEAFFTTFATHLRDLSDDSFSELKETVLRMKKVEDLSLGEEVARNWAEIQRREFMFDRLQRQTALVSGVCKQDVIDFFTSLVCPAAQRYRKLSVQVEGRADYKTQKPPPLQQLLDSGPDSLKFSERPADEASVPATCASPPVFVLNCDELIRGLAVTPCHFILQ